jgi:acetyl-CoA synthetase
MLMRAGEDVVQGHDLSQLRLAASVGEPLTPDAVRWSERVWGTPLHDTWWQTETGGIMIANLPGREVRPGSMGVPLPGVVATILARDEHGDVAIRDGHVVEVEDPLVGGHLALQPGWPSMFRGYLHDPQRTAACFVDGWYDTGDIARRDRDGYYWFVARADDVIKSAGHLVGPFEIETVLLSHPAIVDAGVIGVPDAVAGERVKAFVSVRDDVEPTPDLARELIGYGRSRLGAAVAPREIAFDPHLPHTRSGKIMRRLLKARELGEPEGDLSTLERT